MDGNATLLQIVITILTTTLMSSGFWAFVMKRNENKNARNRLLMGLAQDRILYLGLKYIDRGWISQDEYENLHEYLYCPYQEMGGNGSAERIMKMINNLPIKHSKGEFSDAVK